MPYVYYVTEKKQNKQKKKRKTLKLSRNSTIKKGTNVSQLYWTSVSFILLGKAKSTKILVFFFKIIKIRKFDFVFKGPVFVIFVLIARQIYHKSDYK